MKTNFLLFLIFIVTFSLISQTYEGGCILTVRSHDSINDLPRAKGALGLI